MSVPFDVPHPVLDSTPTTTTASTVAAVVVAGAVDVDVVGCQFKTNELMAMKILAVSVE